VKINRRQFLGLTGTAAGTVLVGTPERTRAAGPPISPDAVGCLVDTTLCIGCRKCEQACNERHKLPEPDIPFEDLSVFETTRRPHDRSYTVVNRYQSQRTGSEGSSETSTYVKFQCMHCNDPACASACIVGALSKQPDGPVTYDVKKCIGCRYCMVACPFEIPAFEYHTALNPEIRKCTFCFEYIKKAGGLPACAQICPTEVIIFGKRSDLLQTAHWKIKSNPGKYVDHIYGEHEAGGTSWMYLAAQPFEEIGLPKLGTNAPPRLTEAIQQALFQFFAVPLGLFGLLGALMWKTGRKYEIQDSEEKGKEP
jgi:formate dehydrogenase iron-sulfur subunit